MSTPAMARCSTYTTRARDRNPPSTSPRSSVVVRRLRPRQQNKHADIVLSDGSGRFTSAATQGPVP